MNEIETEIRQEILSIKTNRHADEAVIRRMIEDKTLVSKSDGKFAISATGQTRAA